MSQRSVRRLAPALVAWGFLAGAALAVAPQVRDRGKFFSPEAVKKANGQIRELYRKYTQDVLIEAYDTVPTDQAEKLKGLDAAGRAEFFKKWAAERARERAVNGIYVVISREPRYVYSDAYYTEGFSRERRLLSSAVARKVSEALIGHFKEKRFDEGLSAAVGVVERHLQKPGG
jgi:uncharacterized membrane protein YgcG